MDSWTVDLDDCHLYLSSEVVPDGNPTTLHLNFDYGSTLLSYRPDFRVLQDPVHWGEEVVMMLFQVLHSGGVWPSRVFRLAACYCQYFDCIIQRIQASVGTSIVVGALITDAAHPPPLPISRRLTVPALSELEEDPAEDAMMMPEEEEDDEGFFAQRELEVDVFGEGEAEKEYADTSCSICLNDFEAGEELLVMPCRHRFHEECLVEWLRRSHVCPLCRFDLSDDDDHAVPVDED